PKPESTTFSPRVTDRITVTMRVSTTRATSPAGSRVRVEISSTNSLLFMARPSSPRKPRQVSQPPAGPVRAGPREAPRVVEPNEPKVDLYGATYGHFAEEIYAEIRREASGEDVGQNSWVTREELDGFARDLRLAPSSRLLDVACGSGGPTLHLVRSTGCTAVGVDVHADAIATAVRLAGEAGLGGQATFETADAAATLPFQDGSFDALLCIDAINHLADRPSVLGEWARLLRAGGRLGFTDPITVTGILASDDI